MEDILDLYQQPYDPCYPQVCFDERPCQLIEEAYEPILAKPGQLQRYDYTYRRKGTCNLFIFFEPHTGWRQINVTAQRTKQDFAHCMKELVDVHLPDALGIRLVLDNLNTHTPAALYETFPPEEARRILRQLEFHYTPKHASWLNMVEIELAILSTQCLKRRIGDIDLLQREIAAWQQSRNDRSATVQWRFTSTDARRKMKRLYPS